MFSITIHVTCINNKTSQLKKHFDTKVNYNDYCHANQLFKTVNC